MVNYGSRLRKKEDNFDNMCFESSKPTVEYHEHGSQDSNNVETKVKPSSVHRETVASTKRHDPGLLESSSGGSGNRSSNPLSKHPRMKSIYIEKEILREDRIWLQFLDDRCAEDTLIIMCVWFDRHHDEHEEKDIGRSHTSSFEKKIPKKIGEDFMYEDWLHCLHRRIFKTRLEICQDKMKSWTIFVRSEDIQVK